LLVGLAWLLTLKYFILKYFITEFRLEMSYYKKKFADAPDSGKPSKTSTAKA
jgi:hypothetical protein